MAPIHAAINQLYANEFLTSPGLQYASPLTLDSYSGFPHGNEHTLNATVAPKNQFADKPFMNVLYSAIDGNINAKQEMRKRAEKLAKFFDSIDPELRIKASDSDVMAELKMYGRAFKGLRDQFIHAVNHIDELVTGPFILGADIIEAGLYYYCGKEYYPVARERNDARIAAVDQLIHADGLTQREAILTMGLAAIFGKVIMAPNVPVIIGPSKAILPAFRNKALDLVDIAGSNELASKAKSTTLTPVYNAKAKYRYIYRGTETKPEIVFEQGFKRDGNLNLQMHMETNEGSGFISTSKSPNVARSEEFVSAGDYVYVIKPQEHGLDVNAVLGKASKYPYEQEIAVPNYISPNDIKGARMVNESNKFTGKFINNPNYKH